MPGVYFVVGNCKSNVEVYGREFSTQDEAYAYAAGFNERDCLGSTDQFGTLEEAELEANRRRVPLFRRSDSLPNWYVLEHATPFGIPEGTKAEWRSILAGLKRGEVDVHKRVGTIIWPTSFALYSPRNARDCDWYECDNKNLSEFCTRVGMVLDGTTDQALLTYEISHCPSYRE